MRTLIAALCFFATQALADMTASEALRAVNLDHTLAAARARVSGSNAGMDWMWP